MPKKRIEIDYYFMKELLIKNNSNIRVNIKSKGTTVTFLSSTTYISSDLQDKVFNSVVDCAKELIRLAEENNNFESIEHYWIKKDHCWQKFDRPDENYLKL